MSTTGRAFVAVVPPPAVLDAIDAVAAPLRASLPDARWTTRAQWHVTLQFLGNHVDLDAVAGALGALAASGGDARLGGGGAFPSARRGRVLWVALAEGAELLTRLADGVGALLAPLGSEPETRPHHAHLTLARLTAPGNLHGAVAALADAALGPAWPVEEIALFRSHTKSTGAEYEPISRVALSGDSGTASVDQ